MVNILAPWGPVDVNNCIFQDTSVKYKKGGQNVVWQFVKNNKK